MAKIHRSDGLIFTKQILRVNSANLVPIPAGITVLNFAVVDIDPLNGWDGVNFRYTITEDGEYLITVNGSYTYPTSAPSEAGIQIYKNGSQLRPFTRETVSWQANRSNEFSGTWQGILVKNDFVDARANQQGSSDVKTVSGATFMEILRLL